MVEESSKMDYQLDYDDEMSAIHQIMMRGEDTDNRLTKVLDILTDEESVRRQGVGRLLIGIAEKMTENRSMMVQAVKGKASIKRGIENRNLALTKAQLESDREERLTTHILQSLQTTMERRIPGTTIFEQRAPIDDLKDKLESRLQVLMDSQEAGKEDVLSIDDRICDTDGSVYVIDEDGMASATGEQAIVQEDGINAVLEDTGEVLPIFNLEEGES